MDISGEDPWLPYLWANVKLFPLGTVSTGLKRRRGIEGTYLEETFVVSIILVVPWKLGTGFVSPEYYDRTLAVLDNERRATEENWRISTALCDIDVLNLSATE